MPPIDPGAVAQGRADILTKAALGQSVPARPATLSRWRRAYAASGKKGLEPDYTKCGRKPLAKLNEMEEIAVKQLYIKTGSATTALRLFANTEACSQEAADAILKVRASKHNIPRSIRHQIELPAVVMEHHQSPKRARTHFFINPRSLTYMTPHGEVDLQVGDLSERDDMSNNFLVWVDWPMGGDPCSDKFGVRIARGQLLCQIDVRSLYFQSFVFLIRLRDSYRADDIWQWVGQSYRDIFVPAIGERWERGIWASNKLRGHAIEEGHTPNAQRIGGLQSLGKTIIESHSPTTKIIENRFNFFQTACSTIPGQIGRSRGEMERENKLWTECREGRRDPRKHFLSYAQACEQLEGKMQFVNHEPMEGMLYRGVPADLYNTGVTERGDELVRLAPEQTYLFSRDLRFITCSKAHAMVRYTAPEGGRRAWYFHHPDLYKHEGQRLAVYLDEECPGNGAVVIPIRPGRKPEPIACELVEGMPQFALGLDMECGPGAQAMVDASLRRDRQNAAVRSEYRAIGLAGRRLAKTSQARDGAGRSTTVEQLTHTDGRGDRPKKLEHSRVPDRGASSNPQPLSNDADYMRQLEEKFREAHPDLAIT
jgi:hypothetical protein